MDNRPKPLAAPALYGLAGDFVRTVEPHSEADPAGLLVQFLAAFGNAVGSGPRFHVEADRHGTNLFVLLVGKTSSARKGTSWGQVRRIFDLADPAWAENRVQHGLSSGEGLIWTIRDPIYKGEDGASKLVDPGIEDKRLLVVEAEFASPLRVMSREGNNLSPTLRCAWDSGKLSTLVKHNAAKATGAHVTLIGHSTQDELLRELDGIEMANGFANRFLFVHVRRSKHLAEGGSLSSDEIAALADRVRAALAFARNLSEVRRDEAARALWRKVYAALTYERPGLLGAVTARGAPQVVRLSLGYALLDRSPVVRVEHLRSALAVWDYSFQSARMIFGDALGDPVADEILRALRREPEGMTRTDIHGLFGRHRSGDEMDTALRLLQDHDRAFAGVRQTAGRSAEVWRAKDANEGASFAFFAGGASSGGPGSTVEPANDWGSV